MTAKTIDNSGNLFNHIKERFKIKNDFALSIFLDVSPPTISKIRNGRQKVNEWMLLHIHEKTRIPVQKLRAMMPAEKASATSKKSVQHPVS